MLLERVLLLIRVLLLLLLLVGLLQVGVLLLLLLQIGVLLLLLLWVGLLLLQVEQVRRRGAAKDIAVHAHSCQVLSLELPLLLLLKATRLTADHAQPRARAIVLAPPRRAVAVLV